MGMAASQARLLSITARLTDNEQSGQAVSYAKERLANQADQIEAEYNNALSATKFTVLTSFNGADANYSDLSYALITSAKVAELGKQYVVTDTRGRVLVTEDIAQNFIDSNGDLNKFLSLCGDPTSGIYNGGYSISDLDPAIKVPADADDTKTAEQTEAEEKIHDAWDKYLTSVGIEFGDEEHDFGFGWMSFGAAGEGYATYTPAGGDPQPINFEGTTKEQRELYDYAVALTESYCSTSATPVNTAYDADNKQDITYYQNLFYKMQSCDFFTYTNDPNKAAQDEAHYVYTADINTKPKDMDKSPLNDATFFVEELKKGNLQLQYYSTSENDFVETTLSEDASIQEVKDESKIAEAERKYTQALDDLEHTDNRYDLQLKKLDTEHNTLQTEYDSVKNVVDKNVEKTFSIFS